MKSYRITAESRMRKCALRPLSPSLVLRNFGRQIPREVHPICQTRRQLESVHRHGVPEKIMSRIPTSS